MASPVIGRAPNLDYSSLDHSPERLSRLLSYSGTAGARLPQLISRLSVLTLILILGLVNGGCAISYRLDSLFNKTAQSKDEVTGSVGQGAFAAASATDLLEADLVYVRAAATDLLARGGKDASASWENPSTGAHGTVTPLATGYTQDGATCRDFLASYLRGTDQSWLQGAACRVAAGRWEVKSLKPLQRT